MEGLTRVCREDLRDIVPLTRVDGHLEAHTPFFSSELSLTLRAERFFLCPGARRVEWRSSHASPRTIFHGCQFGRVVVGNFQAPEAACHVNSGIVHQDVGNRALKR